MARSFVLYNPLADNKRGEEKAFSLKEKTSDDLVYQNILEIRNYEKFFASLHSDDSITICGGDGTLNHFINNTEDIEIQNNIWYYATGSGNDFLRDVKDAEEGKPVLINKYLKNLPTVTVKGKKYRMLNGIGYGIDGYCCEIGDKIRLSDSTKEINYAGIAIKGLLFHYKPTNAKITVDGKTQEFKKVWLAPTMNGRFYGGGMMPTPDQDRLSDEHTVSVLVLHGSGKLKTLMVFPKIFSGEHVKRTEMCTVLKGKTITVEFDRPVAAQVDGETVLGVTGYTVKA